MRRLLSGARFLIAVPAVAMTDPLIDYIGKLRENARAATVRRCMIASLNDRDFRSLCAHLGARPTNREIREFIEMTCPTGNASPASPAPRPPPTTREE